MVNLKNKNVIITGASRGIGFELSKCFIKNNANIIICSKNKRNIKNAFIKLKKLIKNDQKLFYSAVDVSSELQVKRFIKYSIKKLKNINILINNAGIYGPKGLIENIKWNEWKKAIDTNLFGSVLMSRALISHFKRRNEGKIIQLSGGGVAGPLPRITSYGVSKIGIVKFVESLSEEVKDYKININTVAPGAINTQMLDELIASGPKTIGMYFYKKALHQKNKGGTGYKNICDLVMYLSSKNGNGIKGKIIHALWDDWKSLKKYSKQLTKSDVFTLKRVSPIDRNFKWGISDKIYEYDTLFSPKR